MKTYTNEQLKENSLAIFYAALKLPEGIRADLSGANLYGADLSHANLRGAKLSGADLSLACLLIKSSLKPNEMKWEENFMK